MPVQKGLASTSATNLLASARHFHFGVQSGLTLNADGSVNTLPNVWQLTAGGSVTLVYRSQSSGLTPTTDANKVTLIAYYETGTGTVVRTLASNAAITDGQTYTFYGTSDGTIGGAERCGTLRLYVNAIKDNSTGGLQDYNVNSDTSNFPGALRVNMKVTNLAVNAYPAGSTFAYGTTANEVITLTATHTQRYADRDLETFRIDALDLTVVQASGTAQEIGTTTTAQTFIANNTFDSAANTYGMRFTTVGASALIATEKWALPVGSGNATQNGTDSVQRQSFYNVDPRITINSIVMGQSLYNRGEATTTDFSVLNARAEAVTRSVNYELKDSLGTVKKSGSLSGATKQITYTVGVSDDAAYDFVGKQWTFNTTQGDVTTNPTANTYRVSSKLMFGSTVGSNNLLMTSVTDAVKNRGELQTFSYHVSFARGTAYASKTGLNQQVFDGTTTTTKEDEQLNETTDANGLVVSNYTVDAADLANYNTVGRPKDIVFTDDLGNSADRAEDVWFVSSKLLIGSAVGLNDLVIVTNHEIYNRGESPQLSYYLSYARGAALVSRQVSTQVHDDAVTSNAEDIQLVTTTAGGQISYSYLVESGDKATPDFVGSPKHIEVSWSGNTTDDSANEWSVSSLLVFTDTWTGKNDGDLDGNGIPDSGEETDFFVGADVLYTKAQVENVRGEAYDDAAVTTSLLRNNSISQGPKTGAITQTESGYNGWQDLFYEFDVKAPAGARTVRYSATRNGNDTGNVDVPINYAPSYTGNLEMSMLVDFLDSDNDRNVKVIIQPFILTTSNVEQRISEAVPAANMDIKPKITLKKVSVADPNKMEAVSTNNMVAANAPGLTEDDDWYYEFTNLDPGFYTAEVSMTVNGGQFTETINFAVAKVSSSGFNFFGYALNGVP